MLGLMANKKNAFYVAKWISIEDKNNHGFFRFEIEQDDNLRKVDFNKMSGYEGDMIIKTKSLLPFMPEDIILFRGSKYNITKVDGNRKDIGEAAQAVFNTTGNVNIFLTLRKAGA